MEKTLQVCPSCGKQNPAEARFCYECGTTLVVGAPPSEENAAQATPVQDEGVSFVQAETQVPQYPYEEAQPQYAQSVTQPVSPPVYQPAAAPQGVPPAGYPSAYPQGIYPPPKPPRRGRMRCCAIGCLVVLLVLVIGLPILHVTVLRPFIETEIYREVHKNLEDVAQDEDIYYGSDIETITERKFNLDAEDAWRDIPGSSEGHIYFLQDQIKLELKIFGVKVWAAADLRVNNRGEFVVKSIDMHWLLHIFFSEGNLKREIAEYANDQILRPRQVSVLAFQVSDGQVFIVYERK